MAAHINDRVVAIVALNGVIPGTAHNSAIAFPAPDDVGPTGVEDYIVARTGYDSVIAGARTDEIVAFPGLDDVVSTQAGDDILAGCPYQNIIAKSTDGGGRYAQARDGTCLGGGGSRVTLARRAMHRPNATRNCLMIHLLWE